MNKEETVTVQDGYHTDESVADDDVKQLSTEDKHALTVMLMNRKIALLTAEKTLAQHELSEMTYKYNILQLYMKYGLNAKDVVTEAGDIIRDGVQK